MAVETAISFDEYLNRAYSPDREHRDGVLVERKVGDKVDALLQVLLTI
jgi:hypothetical protein